MSNSPKYYKVDSQQYLDNPKKYAERDAMAAEYGGSKCMPVGIYDGFISQKGEADILEKSQYNIRDRFGFLSEDDIGGNTGELV